MKMLWTLLRSYLGARARFRSLRGDALAKFQDRRARETVAFAVARSPFYRRHFAGRDPAGWRSLPPIDKSLMMAHFDELNTRGVRRDDAMATALRAETGKAFEPAIDGLTVGLSSGTSGHRGLFLVDRFEQLTWAGTILARGLHGLGRARLAFFLRSNSRLYQRLGVWLEFRYFDLLTPLAQAVEALNAYQPNVLAAPPSVLAMLAEARERGTLRIRPERLISVAEVLDPQDELRLRGVFGVDVHQVYQCTEGLLAISCARGSLHLQEDIVAVQCEPLGEGRVTPVVTDLWRRTQPIIRYRLGDVLTLADGECGCGSAFRVLTRIESRSEDVCHFVRPDGKLRAIFPDTLRRALLAGHAGIDDYRIDHAPGALHVRLKIARGSDPGEVARAVERAVAETAARYDCLMPAIRIEEGLQEEPAGVKRRRFRRVGS
jgi:putative adenylate-forming enzyme